MADAMTAAGAMPAAPAGAPGEAEQGSDLAQGFCIEISVLPDGTYKVSGPEPLADEAAEEQGEAGSELGQDFDSIGAALKQVLQVIKDNPLGDSDQANFEAGYAKG